ncbi:hypothetical protein V8E54_009746 [Elaphomyces granulatus]
MLIARVHLHLEAKRIRGLQYQYTGHTVCFMNNSTKLYDTLPLLPRHLDLFLLRPLPAPNCPAYYDIRIDADASSQLPEDGNVLDDILTMDDDLDGSDAGDSGPPDGEGLDDNDALEFQHSSSVVPDLLTPLMPPDKHVHKTQRQQTPIDESSGQALYTMALPILFPLGKADFSIPRLRTVSLSDWAQHLMRYKDGRFESHPRFRYMMFNQIMRQRVGSSSRWFANKNNGHSLTADDLRQLLDPDSVDYNPLLQALYYTFSAADMQWDDLQRQMPRYDELGTLPETGPPCY